MPGAPPGPARQGKGDEKKDGDKKKGGAPAPAPRIGKKKQRRKGGDAQYKIPRITPHARCRLKLLRTERVKDYLSLEKEFIENMERMRPHEERVQEERSKVDEIRGSPMQVGSLEEIIDENHAIVSSSTGPEYYVPIMSFVDKDELEPGCQLLLHNRVMSIVGLLQDDVDPLVSVMKVDKV